MRSGGQGTGAGCAMKVGITSPGINTETPLAYTVILGEGWLSFPLKPNWASRSPLLRRLDGVKSDEVGLRNLSKIAMTKNMEMRMAVATKPNDTALTELLKAGGLPGCSSLCMFSGAPIGGHSKLCSFTTTIFTSLTLSIYLGPIHSYHVNFYVTFLPSV